jgi:hypothetical protein
MVQTGGIVLALLNFAFILFKFLNRLQTSDAAIEAANEENREILTSVREGLFLLTPTSGSARSCRKSPTAVRPPARARRRFLRAAAAAGVGQGTDRCARLCAAAVRAPRQGSAGAGHQSRCPRSRSPCRTAWARTRRHLSFHFNRVQEDGVVRHLLVTVQDISTRIELEAKLQASASVRKKNSPCCSRRSTVTRAAAPVRG